MKNFYDIYEALYKQKRLKDLQIKVIGDNSMYFRLYYNVTVEVVEASWPSG